MAVSCMVKYQVFLWLGLKMIHVKFLKASTKIRAIYKAGAFKSGFKGSGGWPLTILCLACIISVVLF
jgi:hypothetical protein